VEKRKIVRRRRFVRFRLYTRAEPVALLSTTVAQVRVRSFRSVVTLDRVAPNNDGYGKRQLEKKTVRAKNDRRNFAGILHRPRLLRLGASQLSQRQHRIRIAHQHDSDIRSRRNVRHRYDYGSVGY